MDRNPFPSCSALCKLPVALRKESVDRNEAVKRTAAAVEVALRKESVDRNTKRDVLDAMNM